MTKITVFSTSTCSYCGQLKKLLDYKKIKYTSVNLDDDVEGRKVLAELSGATTVPQTIIEKDGEQPQVVVGYNISQLLQAVA